MPELKHSFQGGKMEKDLDERIVPNGQYREALNIGVATSEDSDVGAAQNILGNIKVTKAIQGQGARYEGCNKHIAAVVDPQTDMVYRFVNTECPDRGVWMDRIVEYNTTKRLDVPWHQKEAAVMVDIYRVEVSINSASQLCQGDTDHYIITLTNLNQTRHLRWGMWLRGHSEVNDKDVYIEHIDYNNGNIRLSGDIGTLLNDPNISSYTLYFSGDRNLNFHPDRKITGINIIDGMIFWTDNYSEPKKVNIERGKLGSDGSNWNLGSLRKTNNYSDFDQHTLLVVDEINPIDCIKDESICPIYGCTDPLAFNYDPNADLLCPDNCCCYNGGCTDDQACNYDREACWDDGSCCYVGPDDGVSPTGCGCTDPAYCNYDPLACADDGSCDGLPGCMDPIANNFDPNADCDDGSCAYNWDCVPAGYTNDNCPDGNGTPGGLNDGIDDIIISPGPQHDNMTPYWGGGQIMALSYFGDPANVLQTQDFTSMWFRATAQANANGGHPTSSPNWSSDGYCWRNEGPIIPYQTNAWSLDDVASYTSDVWTQKTKLGHVSIVERIGILPYNFLENWFDGLSGVPGNTVGYDNWSTTLPNQELIFPQSFTSANTGTITIDTWAEIVDFIHNEMAMDGFPTGITQFVWANDGLWQDAISNGYIPAGSPNDFFPPAVTTAIHATKRSAVAAGVPGGFPNVQGILAGPHHAQTTIYGQKGRPWLVSTDSTNPGYSAAVAANGSETWTSSANGSTFTLYAGDPWPWFIEGQPISFELSERSFELCECNGWLGESCQQDPNGPFTTEQDCLNCNNCNCNPALVSYDCIDGNCVQAIANNGQFTDYTAQQAGFIDALDQCNATCSRGPAPLPPPPTPPPTTPPQTPPPPYQPPPPPPPQQRETGETMPKSTPNKGTPLYMTEQSFKSYVLKNPSPLKMAPPLRGDVSCKTLDLCRPVFVLEKHMTVIRKGPTMPPALEMYKWTDSADINSDDNVILESAFTGDLMPQSATWMVYPNPAIFSLLPDPPNTRGTAFDNSDISVFFNTDKEIKKSGDLIVLPIDAYPTTSPWPDWESGDHLTISHEYTDNFGTIQTAVCRVDIISLVYANSSLSAYQMLWGYPDPITGLYNEVENYVNNPYSNALGMGTSMILARVVSINTGFPIDAITVNDVYTVELVQTPAFFKYKFPKFSYRYQYEDGEYSVFGPWSEVAFIPESFDYMPKKGYNLGMVNDMRSLKVLNWRPKNMPKDVVKIDILYKESNSPNIYTVESFGIDDEISQEPGVTTIPWDEPGTGDHYGKYTIKSELIHKVVASNQLLRPWDNVPRMALGQEITANRLIYANYVESYDLIDYLDQQVTPSFSINVSPDKYADFNASPGEPTKSLKSMRTYQVGVVYRDRYGRETPVLTDYSGSIEVEKGNADKSNRLEVKMQSPAPNWAESYTFYIKETSNEYYNLAMDRWYDAEDGGIWLSFPSAERNKIMDDDEESGQGSTRSSYLILKKQHNSDKPTPEDTRYKILSVRNTTPHFIRTDYQFWGSIPMMLPPPGWGTGGKVGNWDTGMFAPTGLPIPDSLYIDVYAEYWDQSLLNELSNMNGAQVRIVQSAGQASAYVAGASVANNKTNWYDVANVSYIGTPAQTQQETTVDPVSGDTVETEVELPGQVEQLVRITLERSFGNDATFCLPTDHLSLNRGLSLEARTEVTRDKAQFQGRFFVKILRDANIDLNIVQPTQPDAETWQILQTKDVKYICAAHPGLQDWCNDPNLANCTSNFVPVGQDFTGTSDTSRDLVEVSSFSEVVINTGAFYKDISGTIIDETQIATFLPFGPSDHTDGAYHNLPNNWFHTEYKPYLDLNDNFPDLQPNNVYNTWPSYLPKDWNPYSCNTCDVPNVPPNQAGNWRGVLDLSDGTNSFASNNIVWAANNYLRGANPYQLPAIWGDQSDLKSGSLTTPIVFNGTTIDKLKEDWYYLYYGDSLVDDSWPRGRFSPERWFVDKAGAAAGHSGNGIWDDCGGSGPCNGYMQLSYYGIGSTNSWSREWDMTQFQDNEVLFADTITTVGTKFRFEQDPDEVVYTVVKADAEQVLNYEAQQGRWGWFDNDPNSNTFGMCTGGGGLGTNQCPPYGSPIKDDTLGNNRAFISDLFNLNKTRESSGGALYNRRLRFTLTLDKPIGVEGIHKFHPITNHVDATGKANMKGGRVKYDTNLTHVTTAKGGTPSGIEFFNLASYWNANDNAGNQSGTNVDGGAAGTSQLAYLDNHTSTDDAAPTTSTWYAENPGAYIGLHERGLNETTIQIVTPYKGEGDEPKMSTNPAIWETEPMEDIGLDIYYAASPTYPITLKRHRSDELRPDPTDLLLDGTPSSAHYYDYSHRGEEFIPVGATVSFPGNDITLGTATVCAIQGNMIWLDSNLVTPPTHNTWARFEWDGDGSYYGAKRDKQWVEVWIDHNCNGCIPATLNAFTIRPAVHTSRRSLGYFNCYTYGTGVETNRIRDDYNAVTIDKGVKASMPLDEKYEEERKPSSLIFSGIYNSTSGINRTNQFIQADPITKDLNPVNGSIQKLFTRDTDLITFCENKVFKILAQKDALFNADGNTNVTSNPMVLGQAIPFTGEYGISTNPESFASESYRVYFSDKNSGAILRLSRDGLTPISDYGMKDWFKDNLRFATSIIGSHDDREDQYNLTIETADQDGNEKAYTLSYTEARKGWVSFKSFIHQGGVSHNNIYYTFPSNRYNDTNALTGGMGNNTDPWGIVYAGPSDGQGETWQHHLDLILNRLTTADFLTGQSQINVTTGTSVIIPGMNVEGNGIPMDTVVSSAVADGVGGIDVTLINNSTGALQPVYIENGEEVTFTTARNSFYGNDDHYSMVKVMFNGDQNTTVKRFRTLNYEGTQTRVDQKANNSNQLHDGVVTVNTGQIYYDNFPKLGWYVHNIETDLQEGKLSEFIDKENKWFDYIRGYEDAGLGDDLDTGEFSLQGLGNSRGATIPGVRYDCMENVCCPTTTCDGPGFFPDLSSCQEGCDTIPYAKYMCVDGACVICDDGINPPNCGANQTWANDSTCGGSCVAGESWDCVYLNGVPQGCQELGDGSGEYSTYGDCVDNSPCTSVYSGCIPCNPSTMDCSANITATNTTGCLDCQCNDCSSEYPSWVGDGYCDDASMPWGVDFNCTEFNFDGGDCTTPPSCNSFNIDVCITDSIGLAPDPLTGIWGPNNGSASVSFTGGGCTVNGTFTPAYFTGVWTYCILDTNNECITTTNNWNGSSWIGVVGPGPISLTVTDVTSGESITTSGLVVGTNDPPTYLCTPFSTNP